MKKKFGIFQYLFFLALGAFFVWLTLKDIGKDDWAQIRRAVANARHWVFIPAALMLFLSHYSRALRWRIMMEPLGYKPSVFNTFSAVMIGYLVNAGVPRLGEVVKCTLLARYEKVRADKLIGTIVVERVVDVFSLMTVFILAFILQGDIFGDFIKREFGRFLSDKAGNFSNTRLFILISALVTFFLLVYFLLKRFGHVDLVAKLKTVVKGVLHGLESIRLIRHKGWFVFHTFFIWLMYLLSTTAGLYAIRETDHLGIEGGLSVLAVGSVGIILTPGGIGAYPLLVMQLMLLYGIDKNTGDALGWLLWSVQTVIILVGGSICLALLSKHNKQKQDEERRLHQQ